MIYNKITKEYPVLFHAPGDKRHPEYKIINSFLKRIEQYPKYSKPLEFNLKIITWNTTKEESCLEKSLNLCGYSYEILSEIPWTNSCKINTALNFLETINEEYVLAADAYDVICLGDLNRLLPALKKEMLISTETKFYPDEDSILKIKEAKDIATPWKYLNSGLWFGRTKFCIEFLKECRHFKEISFSKYKTISDQFSFHVVYDKFKKDVDLDHRCEVFQTITFCGLNEFWMTKSFL